MARQRWTQKLLSRRMLIAYAAGGILLVVVLFAPKRSDAPNETLLAGEREVANGEALVKLDDETASPLTKVLPTTESETASEANTATRILEEPAPAPVEAKPPASQPAGVIGIAEAQQAFQKGVEAQKRENLLEARTLLNKALRGNLPEHHEQSARKALRDLAERTIFSKAIIPADPIVEDYVVKWGDNLAKIAKKFNVTEDLLAEINQLPNKDFIRKGQRLKVVHGPFHAQIEKSTHRMHLYLQETYVETFRVALGTNGGTPTGKWKVRDRLTNPSWVDPRTGQRWHADDPQNPIGEFWIGLEGIEGQAVGQFGYGIHGTIEPETIGSDVSLGCVRLAADDIARVFHMLVPDESIITIVR